ncbi:MAG: segregation/condensation protein A [Candidatus Bipolaricaulota bacterium]|nr:segregation/condensation protein A [Candidatus Bipolaricaulota bacterium]MBS3791814.1 segregation/condensation protein A [Candidatus Bipolaricaulota bacterium]
MAEETEEEAEFAGREGSPVTVQDLTRPDWRERLDEYTYSTDPWDVSVTELASGFMRELDKIGGKNLKLSGRMVLTCAVLLRAKAERLGGRDQTDEQEELEEDLNTGFWGYEEFENDSYIPELELPLKRMSERAVTTDELSQAFSSAVEVYERREERLEEEEETPHSWGMDLESESNFQVKLQRLYRKVKQKLSRGKEVLFSSLLDRDTKEEKFEKFMELLHLQSEGKVRCKQERPFSEIKVELTEDEPPAEPKTESAQKDE